MTGPWKLMTEDWTAPDEVEQDWGSLWEQGVRPMPYDVFERGLKPNALIVLLALLAGASTDGKCPASVTEEIKIPRFTPRKISEGLVQLEALQLVVVERDIDGRPLYYLLPYVGDALTPHD
jgi:hypothetical protein